MTSIDAEKYIEFATKYAEVRWGWDDETMIRTYCETELKVEKPVSPKIVIDELADEFGFDDPFAPYGLGTPARKTQCDLIEAQIKNEFPAALKSMKP